MITMVDKRVAKALVVAVRATNRHISITEVACQAAAQGLLPCDLDNVDGADALTALALAIRSQPGQWHTEPRAWTGAVWAALQLVGARGETRNERRAAHWRARVHVERARRSAT
jgi:hypothetical protein